ncbi:type III-B CRISPR-associated protein Cas10/Cmr2 [Acidianus sp. HS-5]|uniref:type III-B CRISPR-associated protein Cas10/Cmr2 n=1 Tax=Acidianus sp. HS-5 TaxID=2886040 RepID=UPI001F000A35|nr:type III-B CRISPR-associated protein Cas10/Cmr2 [Acidianus sp. HS-5]BDC18767.1 type III-B CRISPR-associated protein Cas10/Cmr2 [Acidianus sp. HS-5]
MDDDFFLYKIYALFHDPPHKMTVGMVRRGHDFFREFIKNQKLCNYFASKIYDCSGFSNGCKDICETKKGKRGDQRRLKAHEVEALLFLMYLLCSVLERTKDTICSIALQPPHNSNAEKAKDMVHSADVYASEFNRWVLNYLTNNRKMVKYSGFHNIFEPTLSKTLNYDIKNENDFEDFVLKFRSIIDKLSSLSSDIKYLYFLIYTIYEPLWIYHNLPVEVEDSRAPYFTIFDHLYATASMINWTYYGTRPQNRSGIEPKGFYVVIDIPGVQEIVNSARKAGDYWAGSWMLSMIIWLTVWQLIKEYGPDVLLAPTARFNPLYYAMVLSYLKNKGAIDDDTKSEVENVLNTILGELSGIYDYKQFIKEAIIPATASLVLPKEPDSCSIKLEQKVLEYYRNAYNCILKEIPSGQITTELCNEFISAFGINSQQGNNELIDVIINEAEKYVDKVLIRPAIYVVDIDEIKEEVNEDLKEKGVDKILNCNDINILENQYLFHYITTKLYRKMVKDRYKTEILPKPQWFTSRKMGSSYVVNRDFNYINGRRDWEYCTVCGNEPAIINFGKEDDDYSESTKEELSKLVPNQNVNNLFDDLKVWFKPGEKVGPLCIIKRGLYYRLHNSPLKVFRSTDDIAYSYYKEVLQPIIKDAKECEELKDLLYEDEINIYEKLGNPIKARKLFSKCTELDDKTLGCVQKDYELDEVNKAFKNAIKGYREFYAIIKADVDDMTESARAEIEAEKYFEVISGLLGLKSNSYTHKSLACSYVKMITITNSISNGYILMTPTYRVALSAAMMITLLRDIKTVEVENHGQIIYAGGDDVVTLVPIDRLIDTIIDLEENFVSEDGFFKARNWYIPSISPHGRSMSVRITNIADFMTNEIQKATELLSKVKKVKWYLEDRTVKEKFSVIISSSRSSYESILPMWDFKYLRLLKSMWTLNLSNVLSSSVFEDYEEGFKELIDDEMSKGKNSELIEKLINYVLARNNGKGVNFEFDTMTLETGEYKSNIVDEIFKGFRLMRGTL